MFPLDRSCASALDLAQTPPLICRNQIRPAGAENVTMRLDPEPGIRNLGERRPSLSMVLAIFIVLAGVIAVVAILIAYGLMGSR
jgi:hypothetical protein